MPRLLTRRKEKWVKRRKPSVVRGAPLSLPTLLEARFTARLERMVRIMCDQVEKDVTRLFRDDAARQYFNAAQDASITSQARILTNALMKQFNRYFAVNAPAIAERQAEAVNKASSAAVHSSIKQLSGGLSLPTASLSDDMLEVLNSSTIEMTSLIKSISIEYLGGVQQAVVRSIASGRGLADLKPYLEKHRGITERRARMIAQDQTRKAYNNMNRERMQRMGLTAFEWLHTGGSAHPRKLHQGYNGRIFLFDDLPVIDENTGEKGIPGQAINCRCRMLPVIDYGE